MPLAAHRFRPGWIFGIAFVLLLSAELRLGAQSDYSLEFLADLNLPTGTSLAQLSGEPQGSPAADAAKTSASAQGLTREEVLRRKASGDFGGISALAYDPASKELYALSDSTNPTLFVLKLELEPRVLRLKPQRVVRLLDEQGSPLPLWTLDPEGFALLSDGSFLVASEGYVLLNPPVQAGIFRFTPDGRRAGSYPIPAHFLRPLDGGPVGVQPNLGFESLSISPDGKTVFAATEGPLSQDQIACGADRPCPIRVLQYAADRMDDGAVAEFFYRCEPAEAPADFGTAPRSMGLSEILALDGSNLLTLERGFSVAADGRVHQVVRIFHVKLPIVGEKHPGDDSSSLPTLRKRLVLDLATIASQFSDGYRTLDNFEGMCLGPRLQNGDRTVLVVSDNNYNERQRTSFLALRLRQRQDSSPRQTRTPSRSQR